MYASPVRELSDAVRTALGTAPRDTDEGKTVLGWIDGPVRALLDRLWASPFSGFVAWTPDNINEYRPVIDKGFCFFESRRSPDDEVFPRLAAKQYLLDWRNPMNYRRMLVALWLSQEKKERTGAMLRKQAGEKPWSVVSMACDSLSWFEGELPFVGPVADSARRGGLDARQRLVAGLSLAALKKMASAPVRAPAEPTGPAMKCTPSHDFTAVVWWEKTYRFNKRQASCVALLWEEWLKGGLSLSEKDIGERIESENKNFRLQHVFRVNAEAKVRRIRRATMMHPAWGTMIVKAGKGTFRLAGTPNEKPE